MEAAEGRTLAEKRNYLSLSLFFETAKTGGILVVSEIQCALEEKPGRKVALSSVYNLLHRNGWRKLVPDKKHPKGDLSAREK